MYQVAVPVTNWFLNRALDTEAVLHELRRAGATRVWLCTARGIEGEARLRAEEDALRRNRQFFSAHGIETGVWLSSIGHGGPLMIADPSLPSASFTKLVGLTGKTCEDTFCPSDPAFQEALTSWVERIAALGFDLIMLDDDYRLSLRSCGNGCCCERHMREYARRVGREVRRDELESLIFSPAPDRYREAWLDMGRDTLLQLAQRLRRRVDEVRPQTRMGLCAVMTTWDVDGVSALELTRALAGNTRPFLRTIGAPYWSAPHGGNTRLACTIEVTRLQRHWCADADVELFTEGDAYPRPRHFTPASFLEIFDTALRFDGGFDGILKYMLDYTSSPRYETGYIDAMERDRPFYDWLNRHAGGEALGVDVYCPPRRLRQARLLPETDANEVNDRFFHSAAIRFLCDNSLPIAYGQSSVHAIMGECGQFAPLHLLTDGALLDLTAARALMERGVDVGITALSDPVRRGGSEYFPAENEYVAVRAFRDFSDVSLKSAARVLSTLDGAPVCWLYENAAGQRFTVYAFDMGRSLPQWGATRGYCRQRQLIEALEWTGRRALPAVCAGHPDLYLAVRKTANGLVLGLWNLSCDPIVSPTVQLGEEHAAAEGFPFSARLLDRCLVIDGTLAPFAFTGVALRAKGDRS